MVLAIALAINGGTAFPTRVYCGISDFLLSPFSKDERKKIRDISDDVVEATCIALFESPQAAKKKYSL